MKKFINAIRTLAFHPNRHVRLAFTLLYCGTAVFANFFLFQVYCIPVSWAAVACICFFISLILYPYTKGWLLTILSFFLGTGVAINIYCLIFLLDPWNTIISFIIGNIGLYIFGILVYGAGLLAYLPLYFLYQIHKYFRLTEKRDRRSMLAGIFIPFAIFVCYLPLFGNQFKAYEAAYKQTHNVEELSSRIPANYFTERITGIGFKYHTKVEYVYDGWRPPLHDPLLNAGLWFYSDTFYPWYGLDRISIYQKLFPNKAVWINCPCAYTKHGKTYFTNKTL